MNSEDGDDACREMEIGETIAREIWQEFFPRLASFAKTKLGTTPRRVVDEEDIALSAIKSYFIGVQKGRFDVGERDDLWRLLATIAARKVTHRNRQFFAAKRGGGTVRGESVFISNQESGSAKSGGLEQAADQNQMPEMQEQVFATCEELLGRLTDEKLRKTALMRMEGYSNQEISDRLNCSLARTKQRISRIRTVWASDLKAENEQ